jgi:hypothetical protein
MQEDLGKEEEKASGEASTDVVPTDGPRLLSEPGPSQPSAPPAEPVSNGEATPPTDPDKLTDGAGAMDVDKPGSPANQSVSKAERKEPPILFFRCWRCKRGVHVKAFLHDLVLAGPQADCRISSPVSPVLPSQEAGRVEASVGRPDRAVLSRRWRLVLPRLQ